MCQLGDWCAEYAGDGPSVSVEGNHEPSFTLRVHPGPEGYGSPVAAVLTAEPVPGAPGLCHLKAIQGTLPPGSRERLAEAVRTLGYTRVRWERRSRGGMVSFEFDL